MYLLGPTEARLFSVDYGNVAFMQNARLTCHFDTDMCLKWRATTKSENRMGVVVRRAVDRPWCRPKHQGRSGPPMHGLILDICTVLSRCLKAKRPDIVFVDIVCCR